jgi:hypothetical protein
LRVLPESRFQLSDPCFHGHDPRLLLGDDLQQLRDDDLRLLQRRGAQVRRQRRHTTTCMALPWKTHYIFRRSAKSEA